LIATDPALLGTAAEPHASIANSPAIRAEKRSPKLALCLSIVRAVIKRDDEWSGEKIVLFASETEPIKQYMHALAAFELKNDSDFTGRQAVYSGSAGDKKLLAAFNDPANRLCVLWVSTKAGGTGITLIGANRAIIFHPTHNPAHDLQAFGRLWRPGQTETVIQYRVVTRDSADERILLRQMSKNEFAQVNFNQHAPPVDMSDGGAGSLCEAPREKEAVHAADADPDAPGGYSLAALVGSAPVRHLADHFSASSL